MWVGVGLICIFGWGCGGSNSATSQYPLSVSRLKSLNLGFIEYVSDFDDAMPLAGHWMDGVLPYTKNEELFHSPAVMNPDYGFAMNSGLVGQYRSTFASPSTTITLFDSTDLSRNATVAISTQPTPGRYNGHNTIGFLDGHVNDELVITTQPTLYQQSVQRMKRLNVAMQIYTSDYDGYFPLANRWVDSLVAYTKTEVPFHSPLPELSDPKSFGYALNIEVAGVSMFSLSNPATTLTLFDSTVLSKNAAVSTSTTPNPPRYGTKNTLGYADGHVAP